MEWTQEKLIAEQRKLEESMQEYGVDRLAHRIDKYSRSGRGSYLPGTNHMVDRMITPLSSLLKAYTVDTWTQKSNPRQYLIQVKPDHIAVIALPREPMYFGISLSFLRKLWKTGPLKKNV